jgi:hypothetical protein
LSTKVNLWDNSTRAIFLGYEDLKCQKKLIELKDELDYINIPISYTAMYLFPQKYDNIRKINNYRNRNKKINFSCKNSINK